MYVMSRATQHRSGTRPPTRNDSRRPGGNPPRTPGGTPTRTAPGGGRPPGPRATGTAPDRPTDNRPAPGPGHGPGAVRPTAHLNEGAHPAALPRVPAQAVPVAVPVAVPQPHPTGLFADRLLAVLSGQRPVHWMLRHTAGRAYDELAWLAERGPLRARGTRPVVRDIGYCVPRPGAIEAFARIGAGKQLRAMAFRLEQGPDLRWRCTAVELGGIRPPSPADG